MKSPSLAQRLRLVVDVVFDGNARLAARTAHLEAPAFHRLLTGIVNNPRISTIRSLSSLLGVPVEYLLGTLTAENAQPYGERVSEEFWLLWSHYLHRQQPSRDWLAAASREMPADEKRTHKNLINLGRVFLFPFHQASPLRTTVGAALNPSHASKEAVRSVRQVLLAETGLLELAVATLKAEGYRT